MNYFYTGIGTIRERRIVPVPIVTIPDFDPSIGLYFDNLSPFRVGRATHDIFMRETGMDLKQTGETVVWRYYKKRKDSEEWFVDTRSKIVFNIEKVSGWVDLFKSPRFLGPFIWGLFIQPKDGHFDTGYPAYTSTTYGGNLHVLENANIGGYALVRTLDFYELPPSDLSYEKYPHLTTHRVVVGKSADVDPYWIAGRNGDQIYPAVTNGRAALALEDLEFVQRPPIEREYNGQMVTLDAFCFRGSNTYARIQDLGWICAEEMENTGRGSYLDRRTYIKPWLETCPPPMAYYTRVSFLEKLFGNF